MSRSGSLIRLAVATLLAAAGTVLPAAASGAATDGCGRGDGVTVVVEFHGLRHPDVRACVPDGGGRDAAALLREAGLTLTDVQRQPGFVCRIDGLPADDPCVNTPPADAYWSLWWSDGRSGEWTYSTVMASSLEVPAGGYVGMAWHEGATEDRPSTTPVAGARAGSSHSPAGRSERAGSADAQHAVASGGGLPTWVAPTSVGLLFAVAGAVAVVRRRRGSPGP